MTQSFDVLVIGSGIAGLSFALDVAKRGRSVAILTKKDKADSSTNWAQGGLAAVTAQTDDFAAHVRDTLDAGDGLCDPQVVRAIVRDGPACVRELAEWGCGSPATRAAATSWAARAGMAHGASCTSKT